MFKLRIIILFLIIFVYKSSFSNTNEQKILKYLQNFDSLKSDFIQVNNNGNVLSGKITILRPGKVRVEYNEIPLLIISDGKKIASINKELDSITFYRIKDIPLALLLFKNFSLKNVQILDYFDLENQLQIRLKEKDKESEDFIDILFEKNTFTLKKWTVFKNKSNKTEVLLENVRLNDKINKKIFEIEEDDPRHPIWRDY
ncbi:MAG: outer membrane lipoprotein carrier protein LolA [Alphaproteobacteria bacterium]